MKKENKRCHAQVKEDWCNNNVMEGSEYCRKHHEQFCDKLTLAGYLKEEMRAVKHDMQYQEEESNDMARLCGYLEALKNVKIYFHD